ncbi:MAG: pentapeptide repeat-containing protein [Microcystis sp.]
MLSTKLIYPLLAACVVTVAIVQNGAVNSANPSHVERLIKTNKCPKCDLRGANLRGANLSNSFLQGADLSMANLTGAILINANLSDVILVGAKLVNADFTGIKCNYVGFRINFSSADLSGAKFIDSSCACGDFRGANLTNVDFRGADLSCANLSSANTTGADFRGAHLVNTIMPDGSRHE